MDGLVQPSIWLDCDAAGSTALAAKVAEAERLGYRSGDAYYNAAGQCTVYLRDGQWHDNAGGRTLADCKARFPAGTPLFRGFPPIRRVPFVDSIAISGQPLGQSVDARILDLISEG